MGKYLGPARLHTEVLEKRYGGGEFVFSIDMRDPNSPDITDEMRLEIFDWYRRSPRARFLEQSKNPERYIEFLEEGYELPDNLVLGATIESNRDYPDLSRAPPQADRISSMVRLSKLVGNHLFISCEPVLNFDPGALEKWIGNMGPWAVAVGYDNYGHHLPEPALARTLELIDGLERFTTVHRKTLRRAWWEN
jgi:protein gp37